MSEKSKSNGEKSIILFVEDDPTVCEVCEEYLTSKGFEVIVA